MSSICEFKNAKYVKMKNLQNIDPTKIKVHTVVTSHILFHKIACSQLARNKVCAVTLGTKLLESTCMALHRHGAQFDLTCQEWLRYAALLATGVVVTHLWS